MIWPDKIIFIYMIMLLFYLGAVLLDTYANSNILIDRLNAQAILQGALLIAVLLGPLKILEVFLHDKYKTDVLRRCKQNRAIAFGGIWIFSMLLRCYPMLFDERLTKEESKRLRQWTTPIIHMFSAITTHLLLWCFSLHTLFAFQPTRLCNWNQFKNKTLFLFSDFLNVAALILGVILAFNYCKLWHEKHIFVLCFHFLFFPLGVFASREFFGVLNGSMELKVKSDEVPLVVVNPEKPKPELRLECNICMQDYSTSHTPRILKECGHTVCEGCAEGLLEGNNGHHLVCPFCQRITVVNGPATSLPKNYGILDAMEWKTKS